MPGKLDKGMKDSVAEPKITQPFTRFISDTDFFSKYQESIGKKLVKSFQFLYFQGSHTMGFLSNSISIL